MDFPIFIMMYMFIVFMVVIVLAYQSEIFSKWYSPSFVGVSILLLPYFYMLTWGYGVFESLKVYLILTAFLWVQSGV